jgi:hypothetical protein
MNTTAATQLRTMTVLDAPYAVVLIGAGAGAHVELRPLDPEGREDPYGHASSLLDDHAYDYWAGGDVFRAAVDTAKLVARETGARWTPRTWLHGKLERLETASGDWRDCLDGRPVANGEHLQLRRDDGRWIWVRYETHLRTPYFVFDGERTLGYTGLETLRWSPYPEHDPDLPAEW